MTIVLWVVPFIYHPQAWSSEVCIDYNPPGGSDHYQHKLPLTSVSGGIYVE